MGVKRYKELLRISSYDERLKYLKLNGVVGYETFGGNRYVNQILYRSVLWKKTRREVIMRDNGCDLAHEDYPLRERIYIHHLNPITLDDVLENRSSVYDLDNLVCVSFSTHNAIHYGGDLNIFTSQVVERKRNDTCPWKRG